jgi:Ala-tRNA(Pro) deacylase
MELLGVIPGSVTPFGLINDVNHRIKVVLDKPMMDHAILNFHPLENTATTSIASADLLTFIKATGHEPHVIQVSHGKLDLDAE